MKKKEEKITPPEHPVNSISNCNFHQEAKIVWDAQALEAVNSVAKALLNMTELFKGQKIEIGPGIYLSGSGKTLIGGTLSFDTKTNDKENHCDHLKMR